MLEQVLGGNPVTLGLAGWAAYGPAFAVGILALVLLALPSLRSRPTTARRPDQVVVRSSDNVAIGAYLPGLILGVIAAALAWYGARPQVVIAADALTCRPWSRPLAWSEITGYDANATTWGGRPAISVSIAFAGEMRRGGVETRAEEVAIAVLRGPSSLVAQQRGRGSGTCPLGGLAIDGHDAVGLIEVAYGRSVLGRALPDLDSPQAVDSWCANPPAAFVGRCAELLRRERDECRNLYPNGSAMVLAGCHYRFAGRPSPPARPPAASPPTVSPPAVSPPPRPAPAPPRPPTPQPPVPQPPTTSQPPATPPVPPSTTPPATPPSPPASPPRPTTPPSTTPPASPPPSTIPPSTTPPSTTPPSTTPPVAPTTPPATPPATPPTTPPAGSGKPTVPGTPPGK